ncbi:hypothetical protein BS17DRAFT_181173 [Gyrodon lividus]|nr:hypothetical protein BS17DRAFT_181173 [Gyrodon lividus]
MWMKEFHPTIVLQFVPGGCTSILQPCDVGIQRVFKHLLKHSYHADIVTMMTTQIECGVENLVFDKRRGFLSVRWLWNTCQAVNRPELVKKVSKFKTLRELSSPNCRHFSSQVSATSTFCSIA